VAELGACGQPDAEDGQVAGEGTLVVLAEQRGRRP
jgi:hypothetical protein